MLKSLWSGVSGLQAHQVAMDVEGDNISNVNTVGFKYSRTDFASMLSLTKQAATAPQGDLGGQNDLGIGLGTSVHSTTRVFMQGSMQSTDINTDVALQGDGFFILSGDGGDSQAYSRAGDFTFDANGSLVDNNGYVVQGWVKEIKSGDDSCEDDALLTRVDTTGPIGNIQIDPGLVLPSKKSSEVSLRANLNTGDSVEQMDCIRPLDSDSATVADSSNPGFAYQYDSSGDVIQKSEDFGVLFNDTGNAFNLSDGQGVWASYKTATSAQSGVIAAGANTFQFALNGVDIDITVNQTTSAANATALVAALNNYSDQTGVSATVVGGTQVQLTNLNDDTVAKVKNIIIEPHSGGGASYIGALSDTASVVTAFRYEYNSTAADSAGATTASYGYVSGNNGSKFKTTEDLRRMMQTDANRVKNSDLTNAAYQYGLAPYDIDGSGTMDAGEASVKVTVNSNGRFEIQNEEDNDGTSEPITIAVTNYSDSVAVSTNVLFGNTFSALNTSLAEGTTSTASTTKINAATHTSSIDVFDSLGAKHTLTITFRKNDINQWIWSAKIPEPGLIVGHPDSRDNVYEGGTVTFNSDGSLKGYNPPTLQINPNNGAKAPQLIKLEFGSSNSFDGVTSLDDESSTNNISQNGYAAGNLIGIRIDSTGTMLGSFDNGKSVGLAKLGVATFANEAGLHSEGGNLFTVSANSGDPTIGTASTGSRGDIASSMLEMSNVDLSRSLTNLIVVQRGFQANSKTITTSDQMLNTLLQLKQ